MKTKQIPSGKKMCFGCYGFVGEDADKCRTCGYGAFICGSSVEI